MIEYCSNYKRPPCIERKKGSIEIIHNDITIAKSSDYIRILETNHPPTIYIPKHTFINVNIKVLTSKESYCEWKGIAVYCDIETKESFIKRAGWLYPAPNSKYYELRGWISVYPSKVDKCTIDGEQVRPQEGYYYGGWITNNIIGPFKGDVNNPQIL